MSTYRAGSILAVDFGSTHTRGVLIDLVEGAYRVVAQASTRTTAGFPWGDVGVGLYRVLERIGEITGRQFVTQNGRLISPEQSDRSGVDTFVATASIGRPLRTVLMGLVPTVSIASGLRATAGTYVQVVETITLDDARDEQEQLNAIVRSQPDLIFITGGTEDGARDPVLRLARVAALAMPLMGGHMRPSILYAGNSELVPEIRTLFDGRATLFVAPNVRPSLDEEAVEVAQMQLAMAFDASSSQRGAGFEDVGALSVLGILPTASSYQLIVDYLGKTLEGGVLAVDIGSAVSVLSGSVDGRVGTVIRTDIGLGNSAHDLIATVGVDDIKRWIPFEISEQELLTYAFNKTLRPGTVPESPRGMFMEYAFLRAAVQALAQAAAPHWDPSLADGRADPLPEFRYMIAAGGALTNTGRPALTSLFLLDALGATGVTTLLADPGALVPALGAIAHFNSIAVVQVLESNALERLGVSFNLSGVPRTGRPAMRVKITPEGRQSVQHEVEGGHLWLYPLPPGQRARVEVWAKGGGLTIGGKRHIKLDVEGGTAGLIFDARGRPLVPAADIPTRAEQLSRWLSNASGDAVLALDSAEAEEPLELEPALTPARSLKREKREQAAERPKLTGARRPKPAPTNAEQGDDIDELRDLFS